MGSKLGHRIRLAALAATVATLAGCWWVQPGYDSHRSGFNPHANAITAANAASLEVDLAGPSLPVIEIIRSRTGYLHLLSDRITTIDVDEGTVPWTAWPDLSRIGVPTFLAVGDTLYVPTYRPLGTPDWCLARYDAELGTDLGCIALPLPEPDQIAYVEAVTAGPWIALTANFETPDGGGHAGWLAVVHTSDPGRSWARSVSSGAAVEASNPIIVDGRVFVVANEPGEQPQLQRWALDCDQPDCAPDRETPISGWFGHRIGASTDGTQVAVTGTDRLDVVDLATGDITWTADLGAANELLPSARPTWTPSSLVVTTVESGIGPGVLHRFPANGCGDNTCTPSWSTAFDGFPGGQVAAAADVLVLSTSEEPLVVLPEECSDPCEPLFTADGETFWGAPIVHGGRIWVVARFDGQPDWELRAYRPAG